MKKQTIGRLLLIIGILSLLAVDASAEGSTDVINNYVDTLQGIISDKLQFIGITLVMIFSAILSWKNASASPLGWGAAASIAIAGSSSIGNQLKNLNF